MAKVTYVMVVQIPDNVPARRVKSIEMDLRVAKSNIEEWKETNYEDLEVRLTKSENLKGIS